LLRKSSFVGPLGDVKPIQENPRSVVLCYGRNSVQRKGVIGRLD